MPRMDSYSTDSLAPQAVALDNILLTNGLNLGCVVELKVDEEILLGRILNRAKERSRD